jgi:predicted RNase H-like nuclease (RuvC/YqgF family)
MDRLQAQHIFDRLESDLNSLKQDVINNSSNNQSYSDLEEQNDELQKNLEKAEEERDRFESDYDDMKSAVQKSIEKIESLLSDIKRDHPGYDVDDIEDVISNLSDL